MKKTKGTDHKGKDHFKSNLLKEFYSSTDSFQRVKRQATEWEKVYGRLYMIPLIKSSKTGRAIFSFGEDEEGNCERARKVLLRWLFSVLVQKYLPHDNLLSCIFAVYAPLMCVFFFPWCTWWNKEKSEHDKDCHQNHSYLTLHGGVPARTVGQEQRRKNTWTRERGRVFTHRYHGH